MSNDIQPAKRGRPARSQEQTVELIVSGATRLLLSQGYSATTMEAVAAHCGLAKKTLYRFAANRSELVGLVIGSWTQGFADLFDEDPLAADDLLAVLGRLLRAVADRALSDDAVGLFKLLTQDFAERSLALEAYQANGIEHATLLLANWLSRQAARGLVTIAQPQMLARMILSLVIAEPLRRRALGLELADDRATVASQIEGCMQLLSGQAFSLKAACR